VTTFPSGYIVVTNFISMYYVICMTILCLLPDFSLGREIREMSFTHLSTVNPPSPGMIAIFLFLVNWDPFVKITNRISNTIPSYISFVGIF